MPADDVTPTEDLMREHGVPNRIHLIYEASGRHLMSHEAFADMGETFEDSEHHLFGQAGFAGTVEQVASIERTLGIYDLSQFTP